MTRQRFRGLGLSAADLALIEEARYAAPKQGADPQLISDAMTRNLEQALSFFNGTLRRCQPKSLSSDIGERVTVEAVKAFRRELELTNSPRSVHDILTRLAILCRRLGLFAQGQIIAGVAGRSPGRSRKRAPAICAATAYHRLVAHFESLREEIAGLGNHWRAQARRRRAADEAMTTMMVILLLTLPVRRRNLMGLELADHARRDRRDLKEQMERTTLKFERGRWVIVMPSEETKAAQAAVRVVPPQLTIHLEHYLAEIRPVRVTEVASNALWLSCKGKALSPVTAHNRISKLTWRLLGTRIPMHLFRQLVGRWAVGEGGLGIEAAQQAFQHAARTTTQRSYVEVPTGQAQHAMRPSYQFIHDALDGDALFQAPGDTGPSPTSRRTVSGN